MVQKYIFTIILNFLLSCNINFLRAMGIYAVHNHFKHNLKKI